MSLRYSALEWSKNATPQEYTTYRLTIRGDGLNRVRRLGELRRRQIFDQWSKAGYQLLQYIRRNQQATRAVAYRQAHVNPPEENSGCDLGARNSGFRFYRGASAKGRSLPRRDVQRALSREVAHVHHFYG